MSENESSQPLLGKYVRSLQIPLNDATGESVDLAKCHEQVESLKASLGAIGFAMQLDKDHEDVCEPHGSDIEDSREGYITFLNVNMSSHTQD